MSASGAGGSDLPENRREAWGGWAAAALGVVGFLWLIGWPALLPTNIAWLDFADRAMHTLGWLFFRRAPWGLPPGISPELGIELANSIGLVDGLPLFALPAKLFSALLPQPFQYWGIWLLVCFVLQSVFAYAIARELRAGVFAALLAAAFVLITPAFMFRIGMHLALSGHWTLLAALYLYVRRTPPPLWAWPLLAGLTAGIHAYLLAMVLAIWVAALLERLLCGRMVLRRAALEMLCAAAAAYAMLWAGGFLVISSIGSYGYGDYKLNVLWPLIRYESWSTIFPEIPHTKYDYEGLSFLGIGILGLLLVALGSGAFGRLRAAIGLRFLPLTLVLLGLMVFAITSRVHAGNVLLVDLDLPQQLIDLLSTFRSTGRFVWPLLYFVTIGAVVLVAGRLRPVVALPLLVIALIAQVADSSTALSSFARHQPQAAAVWPTELVSPFWDRVAAAGYTRVRAIPVIEPGFDWRELGYFAVTHGMATDSAYLGRTDEEALDALVAREDAALLTGDFEPKTLYELDTNAARLAQLHAGPADLLAIVDKRIVFAKGGAALIAGLDIDPHPDFGN
jgi:hypothetical protein